MGNTGRFKKGNRFGNRGKKYAQSDPPKPCAWDQFISRLGNLKREDLELILMQKSELGGKIRNWIRTNFKRHFVPEFALELVTPFPAATETCKTESDRFWGAEDL